MNPKKKDMPAPQRSDVVRFAANMMLAAQEWQQMMAELTQLRLVRGHDYGEQEALQVSRIFMDAAAALMADPQRMVDMQHDWWKEYLALLQRTSERMTGRDAAPYVSPPERDRRFRDTAWQENMVYDFIKQSYFVGARWMKMLVDGAAEQDASLEKKLDFYARQVIDALSPSNYLLTNPEVLRVLLETNGESLVKGIRNMREDIRRGVGKMKIRQTDEEAFAPGKNIAITPGKIIFENEMMQLIQYAPQTQQVYEVPLLLIPAWINKFYILDLRPENSLVDWLIGQGCIVFVISWVNPDGRLAAKSFDDYMQGGVIAALDAIEQATGSSHAAVMGYCLGGTLLACTLAWLKAQGREERIVSGSFITTMTDFSEPGELAVFVDDDQLSIMEKKMKEKGYLEGQEMMTTFSLLRANDLIWGFVINNYLLGRDPMPFDLLYWNSDATRMPAAMHGFYLRKMYQKNLLAKPGGITLAGVPIDLGTITTPAHFISCREDHIAPWMSTYAATHLFGGEVTFTLSGSGHVAGVINPPAQKKYNFWSTGPATNPATPQEWLKQVKETPGSWWPHWLKWQQQYLGKKVPARTPGDGKLKPIEDAPGRYVLVR